MKLGFFDFVLLSQAVLWRSSSQAVWESEIFRCKQNFSKTKQPVWGGQLSVMPARVGVQIRLPLLQLLTGHVEHTRFRSWQQPWPLTPVMPWGISSLCQRNLLTRNKCCFKPSHSNVCSGRRPAWGGRGGVCCDCLAARYRSGEGYTKKNKKLFCWTDSSKATVALMIEDQDQDYTKSWPVKLRNWAFVRVTKVPVVCCGGLLSYARLMIIYLELRGRKPERISPN